MGWKKALDPTCKLEKEIFPRPFVYSPPAAMDAPTHNIGMYVHTYLHVLE